MKKSKLLHLEARANELFGENSVVTIAEVKFGNRGYISRIKMQGLPFEISATGDTLEKAEELAYKEFERHMKDALQNDLFPTRPANCYKTIKLTDEEFERLYKYEDLVGDEYIAELKEKTVVKMSKLEDGRFECIIESPYMCLHARGSSGIERLAILSVTMCAHDVFRAPLIHVGRRPWYR